MRVFIAEDNPVEANYFKKLLAQETDILVVGEANDGTIAIRLINKLKPDIVFLDISMPGPSGLEISQNIDQDIKVVFITAYHTYAINAFKLGAVDYILKPIDEERLQITLNRLRKSWLPVNKERLPIKVGNEIIFLDIPNILFIEKKKGLKKVIVYTDTGAYEISLNLNILESKLGSFGFIRTHKSFLVNINKIDRILPWWHKSYLVKFKESSKTAVISRKFAPKVFNIL